MGFSPEESKFTFLSWWQCTAGCKQDHHRYLLCPQENDHYFTKKTKGDPAAVLVMSKALVLPNITMEDKGVYRCRAEIEPMKHMNASARVLVFGEHAFNGLRSLLQIIKNTTDFTKKAFYLNHCVVLNHIYGLWTEGCAFMSVFLWNWFQCLSSICVSRASVP